MKRHHHMTSGQHSRRAQRARVQGWKATAAVARVGVVVMLGTLFTAKINPCDASGGLLRDIF